jgi:Protein of unknown function (DUF3007)
MRRIDVLAIGLAVFLCGGLGYVVLQAVGLDNINAGIWSQVLLILIILGWAGTYLFRVSSKTMTYDQQRTEYEEAVLQKRLDDLTPEQLEKIQAEIAAEKAADS